MLRSLAWAVIAAALVVALHAATVRLDAWLPLQIAAPGGALDGLVTRSTGAAWLATVADVPARGLVGVAWPTRLVVVALGATAIGTAVMARVATRLGLPAVVGSLLALVAAGGPLMWGQATTPSGTALLTALSAGLLLLLRGPLPRRTLVWALVLGLAALVASATATASWEWGRVGTTIAVVRRELGAPGLLLTALGLVHPLAIGLVAAGVLSLGLTAPLGTAAQAAAGLPWAWALVACGITTLLDWRGGPSTRARMVWLVVAVTAWVGIQASGRPWVARAQSTQMSATWAEAVAQAARSSAVVQHDAGDTGALVNAWLRERAPSASLATLREAHAGGDGATSTLLMPEVVDHARWMGLPPADVPAALATLSHVIDALPPDVVVVVGIGADAAAELTADDWLVLGRLGGRETMIGRRRSRALMSITGRRLQGDDVSSADRAVLERLHGDPIGTTGHRSPLDMRIDAGTRDIALFERGRVRATARDLLLAVYRRNGVLLGLWVGAGGRHLGAGRPGTVGPAVRRVDQILPCRLLEAGADVALGALGENGALGVEAPVDTRLAITTSWSDGPDAPPRRVEIPPGSTPPGENTLTLVTSEGGPFGVDLRGRPPGVRWRADRATRVCAAAPLAPVVPLAAGESVAVHPRTEASFGRGWHDMEPLRGGQYFRWSSGRAASLLWTLQAAPPAGATVTVRLDLQNAGVPDADDRLQLTVNGEHLDTRPVVEGRGLYSWTIPGVTLRAGLNEVQLDTTLAVRPSDLQPGADGRLLGFALHGWQVTCSC